MMTYRKSDFIVATEMFLINFVLILCLKNVAKGDSDKSVCEMNACQALEESLIQLTEFADKMDEKNKTNDYLKKLERRLRSLEQPVWEIVKQDGKWMECSKGLCKCKPETKTLSCWQQGIIQLPSEQILPYDVRAIDLGINSLTTLNKDAFNGLSYLTELDLFDNQIDYLPPNVLGKLNSLVYLRLHKNRLEELHSDFLKGLTNLRTFDASANLIKILPGTLFRDCKNLLLLHLSRNNLKDIPETLFNKMELLEDLDLSNNELETLPKFIFEDLVALRRLHLAENNISLIPTGTFDKSTNLELLNLRKNKITHLSERLFDKLANLKILQLTANQISQISPNNFKSLTNLVELHLEQNFINELPENVFIRNTELQKLFLFSNNLEELKEKTFNGLVSLTSLFINNNILKDVDWRIFVYTPSLQKLQLDSNKFHFLPAKIFDSLIGLVSVKLSKNPWHCDCNILYLSIWVDTNQNKLWDSDLSCRGPGDLGGRLLKDMTFDQLCEGQWASMMNLAPRIAIKQVEVNVTKAYNLSLSDNATIS